MGSQRDGHDWTTELNWIQVQLFATPWTGFPVLHYLPDFAQIYSQWCYLTISYSASLFFFCLQSFPASESFPMISVFSSGSFSFSITSSSEYSGLISFRIDCFDFHFFSSVQFSHSVDSETDEHMTSMAHRWNTCISINTYFTVFSDLSVLLFQDLSWTFSWIVVIVQSLIHVRLLQPHGLQHARLFCRSPIPRVCSDSCPLSQWYYLTISSPAASFTDWDGQLHLDLKKSREVEMINQIQDGSDVFGAGVGKGMEEGYRARYPWHQWG